MTKDEAFTKATGLNKKERQQFRDDMKVLWKKRKKLKLHPKENEQEIVLIEEEILEKTGF